MKIIFSILIVSVVVYGNSCISRKLNPDTKKIPIKEQIKKIPIKEQIKIYLIAFIIIAIILGIILFLIYKNTV